MGIFKVKGSPYFHFAFTVKGCRYRGSTQADKRTDAETVYGNERRKALLGETEPNTIILEDAFAKYEEEHAMFLTSYPSVKANVDHLLGYFGKNKLLHDVGQNEMERYVAHSRTETYLRRVFTPDGMVTTGKPQAHSNAIINRRLATFQGMHAKAFKSWKVKIQPIDFSALKLKERTVINNTLAKDAPQKLFDAAPEHIKRFIMISLFTGWRKMNVLTLTGAQIDMESLTVQTIGKGGKLIVSPITTSFARYIRANKLHKAEYVCAYKGEPVKQIKTAWKKLFEKTGIPYIRPHDLRHTFGTWLYEKTGDQRLVQEALNHSDIKTSIRYTHTHLEQRRKKMNKAEAFQVTAAKALP